MHNAYGPPQGGWGPPPGGGYGPPPGGGHGPPPGGGWGPPPGGGWGPPPGGGWGPPPGGGWGPPPGWGQHPHYRPPQPGGGGGGIGPVAAILGLLFGITSVVTWATLSHKGYGHAGAAALFTAVSIWLLVFGVAKILKKKLPVAAHAGIFAGVIILFTALGPTVGKSVMVSKEKRLYAELSSEMAPASGWTIRYEAEIPAEFRRDDWRLQWMNARVREAERDKSAGNLRVIANECADAGDSELLEPAREDAIKALKQMYKAGKERMKGKAGGTSEFPVDESLRQAFSVVLDDLARAKDANVFVAFENSANLDPPKGFDAALKDYRELDPQVRAAFPKRDAPVIDPGSAFSPAFDKRRRATFMTALTESFGQVFDAQLLTLVPLEKGDERDKKIVIEVSSRLYREPSLFVYTSGQTGAERVVGLLFSFQAEWNFKLIGRDGKLLYQAPPTISRPSDAEFSTNPSDPNWAPYSIMMDSAYFNYSREVTGKFGLVPPPKKAFFVYSGAP